MEDQDLPDHKDQKETPDHRVQLEELVFRVRLDLQDPKGHRVLKALQVRRVSKDHQDQLDNKDPRVVLDRLVRLVSLVKMDHWVNPGSRAQMVNPVQQELMEILVLLETQAH